MTDNPLRDSLEESMSVEEQPTEAIEAETEATPDQEVAPQESETPDTEEIESFAEKGELNGRTPEELEEVYKNWQSAYTKKRQEETTRLKDLESKLAEYESTKQQAPQVNQNNLQTPQYREQAQVAQQQLDLGNLSVDQYTQYMRGLMVEEARSVARSEFETLTNEQKETSNQNQLLTDFVSSDPRLDENAPNFDKKLVVFAKSELADALDAYQRENGTSIGFNAKELTREIIAKEDARIDEIIKNRTKRSTIAAKERVNSLRKGSVSGSNASSQTQRGLSIRDHLEASID